MAIYRNVQMAFWTDSKIVDDFTPEDKYFYLYLMTNPHTNLCGCYELSLSQAAYETGYNKDTIRRLLERFEIVHQCIKYSHNSKEVLILNWGKHNWTKSLDFQKPLKQEIFEVKDNDFKSYLELELDNYNTLYRPSYDPPRTTVTVTDTDTVTDSDSVTDTVTDSKTKIIEEIVSYLNEVTGSKYRASTDKTRRCILARLNEKFTVEDFKTVIDKKTLEWRGTEWEKFLRPETLFGTKFEGYLNQTITRKKERGTDWSKIH